MDGIFSIAVGVFIVAILLTTLTKTGRNLAIRMSVGKIEHDFGEISDEEIPNVLGTSWPQKLRILKVTQNGKEYLVLEVFYYLAFQYIVLPYDAAKKIGDIANKTTDKVLP